MTAATEVIMVLADTYATKVAEFARSLALKEISDSMSPLAVSAGDARAALQSAIEDYAKTKPIGVKP